MFFHPVPRICINADVKGLIVGAMVISSVLSTRVVAQRAGVHTGIGRPTRSGATFGLPLVTPIPPLAGGVLQNSFLSHHRSQGYLLAGGGYGYTGNYNDEYQSVPNILVMVPVQQDHLVPGPPPPPARPELHEYDWPKSGTDPAALFSIWLKDGGVHFATVFWVQGDTVRFTTTDGAGKQLPLASVARERTRLANAEKNLTLWLPPER